MLEAKVDGNNGCDVIDDFSGVACPISVAEIDASACCGNRGAEALVIAGVSVGVNVIDDFCEGDIAEMIGSDVGLDIFDAVGKDGGGKAKGDDDLLEGGSVNFANEVSGALDSVSKG